jgi:hypothetical protein
VRCHADNAVLMKAIRYFIIAYSHQLSERITANGERVNCLAWFIHLRETLVFLSRSGQLFSLLLGRANQSTNKPGRLCCLDSAITATFAVAQCFVCIVISRSTAGDSKCLATEIALYSMHDGTSGGKEASAVLSTSTLAGTSQPRLPNFKAKHMYSTQVVGMSLVKHHCQDEYSQTEIAAGRGAEIGNEKRRSGQRHMNHKPLGRFQRLQSQTAGSKKLWKYGLEVSAK